MVGIVPLYLNCGDWERGFGRHEEWMNGRMTRGGYVLISDLNARTVEMLIVDDGCLRMNDRISEYRRSCDRSVNARGRKLVRLLDDEGFVILNGRMQGDESGSLTLWVWVSR